MTRNSLGNWLHVLEQRVHVSAAPSAPLPLLSRALDLYFDDHGHRVSAAISHDHEHDRDLCLDLDLGRDLDHDHCDHDLCLGHGLHLIDRGRDHDLYRAPYRGRDPYLDHVLYPDRHHVRATYLALEIDLVPYDHGPGLGLDLVTCKQYKK